MIKRVLNSIDDVVATFSLIGIIVLVGSNVFFRYVLNQPIQWAEEIAIGLFIWLVFIGISSTMKRDGHIGVDYFINKMPKPLRIVGQVIRAAAIYYVLIYIFIFVGTEFTIQAADKLTPILRVSYQFIDIAIPIGGLLTAIHFTRTLVLTFQEEFGKKGGA